MEMAEVTLLRKAHLDQRYDYLKGLLGTGVCTIVAAYIAGIDRI